MISYLKGKIKLKDERFFILENNGVGYQIFASKSLIDKVREGEEVEIFTQLFIKQEETIELYGFHNMEEMNFFKQLNSVTGVGPKSALGILSIGSLKEIESSIINNDTHFLTKVSGIGKKTAERIVFELKNKIKDLGGKIIEKSGDLQLKDALSNLGYKNREIENVLDKIPKEAEKMEDKIRFALKFLGKR